MPFYFAEASLGERSLMARTRRNAVYAFWTLDSLALRCS